MFEDLEITFGRSVLFEKSPKDLISVGLSLFCNDIHKSNLHCFVYSNGWLIVIRFIQGVAYFDNSYVSFKIIMIKQNGKPNLTKEEINDYLSSGILIPHYKQDCSKHYMVNGIQIIDSSVIICHKNAFIHLLKNNINEIKKASKLRHKNQNFNYNFGFERMIYFTHKGLPPCVRAGTSHNCFIFYNKNIIASTQFTNITYTNRLKDATNMWLKEKNKAKYEISKNIVIKSI